MSFLGSWKLSNRISKLAILQWEFETQRTILSKLWWKYMPGVIISTPWPVGWTKPEPAADGGFTQCESADPNDHFRPWLEKHVGKQGWDWDWKIGVIAAINEDGSTVGVDTIDIKFKKSKSEYATAFKLIYG